MTVNADHGRIGYGQSMPNYTRYRVEGGTVFLTLVTFDRAPIFGEPANVQRLGSVVARMKRERPFETVGAVLLPDHGHLIWRLPDDDADFSSRVGRLKALFTRALARADDPTRSSSRRLHREQTVWQRRFWEHTIRDERDLAHHLDYIHYNPVQHGVASCPHAWPYSSFHRWVRTGEYPIDWYCSCGKKKPRAPTFNVPSTGE